MECLLKQVQEGGVIGAGGAGFPTYVKLDCQVNWVLANGAECEPLLYKDQVLMQGWAAELFGGMLLAMKQVGATRGVIGIKKKNSDTIAILTAQLPQAIELYLMEDVYPAGDEVELVYAITGKRIPSGGLPKDIGVMVNNIESFINVYRAANGIPVTQSMITVHGAVTKPYTAWLPVGITYQQAIDLAGGITCSEYVVIEGGPMMGSVTQDLTRVVTKISSGLLVLPRNSRVARIKMRSDREVLRNAKATCDQCSICSSMCPRRLLGYPIQPNVAMRALQVSGDNNLPFAVAAQTCSGCNLCTMWSCPEGLDPSRICHMIKRELSENSQLLTPLQLQGKTVDVHPLREYRGVPTKRLVRRLELSDYVHIKAKFVEFDALLQGCVQQGTALPMAITKVKIPLSQHIGKPAMAVVNVGDFVVKGQLIGQAVADALSVAVHASIDGQVRSVDQCIIIEQSIIRVNS
ncbi:SLBB domain-containing protein [Shewanella sp. D64]|uniref:4Fe-4S dicluster domain-containing protein n=1 Tax=unclassified Shewanella TaxID=196818 RepID=UPI0022BA31A0|nr:MULTISPECIES: 4Fe-4S dicluster domain-containing protein [unclassified Shewanella]MEC4725585.1 SLBB domain-containing protein [Shewanella sp. D64]MEC4739637.1 SLBB domain-containing protein [Shewanella sp. E94]WBJ94896.1 SLBB domain-containing protein [Shewanella sp. MTB7]